MNNLLVGIGVVQKYFHEKSLLEKVNFLTYPLHNGIIIFFLKLACLREEDIF